MKFTETLPRKSIKIAISLILTLIISILFTGYDVAKYQPIDSLQLLMGNREHIYKVSELSMSGYDLIDEDTIVSNCNDGQLYLFDFNDKVIDILISLSEKVEYNVPIVVYYTLQDEGFSEELACHTQLPQGSKYVEIPVKAKASNIRIDIGNKENEQFRFDRIFINKSFMLTSSRLYICWGVLWIAALLILFRKSPLAVSIRNKSAEIIKNDANILSVFFILILFIMVCILYMNYLTGNKGYIFNDIGSDAYFQTYPYAVYSANAIADGSANTAHWNYTNSLGNASGAFKPTIDNWYLFFGEKYVIYMMGLNQALKVFFAGILFFLYLRIMGISRWTSSIFAICYAFNAHIILRGSWPSYPSEAVLLALWLCGFEYWRKNRKQWGILLLTLLIFYWNMGGGYSAVFSTFILFSYIVFRVFFLDGNTKLIEFAKISAIYVSCIFIVFFILGLNLKGIIEMGTGTERFATGKELLQSRSFNIFTDWNTLYTAFLRTVGTDIVGVTDFVGSQNLLEAPAFYCGLFTLTILPAVCTKVNHRKKVVYLVAIACAISYIIIVPVRFLANGLAGAETFKLSSFWIIVLMLYISASGCDTILDQENKKSIQGTILVTFFALFFMTVISYINIGGRVNSLYRSIILMMVYLGVMLLFMRHRISRTGVKIVIFLLVVGEAVAMSYSAVNDRVTVQESGYDDGTIQALETINDDSFWRVDKQYDSVFLCDSLYQGYMGTKAYIGGTADRQSTLNLYEAFGMPKTGMNRYLWGFSSSTKLNTIANVKYILTRSDIIGNYGYEYLTEHDGIKIYKNKYALPLGYTYNKYILLEDFLRLDVEARRDIIYEACIVEKPVEGMDLLSADKEDSALEVLKDYRINSEIVNTDNGISIILNEKNKDITTVLKVVINNNSSEIFDVECTTENSSQSFRYGALKGTNEYFIDFSDNAITGIDIFTSDEMLISDIEVYQLPSNKYYNKYIENCNKLSDSAFELERMDKNMIIGTVLCNESKMLVFSIPHDTGWNLYIDDVLMPVQEVNIGMMGAQISAGLHDIRLEYNVANDKDVKCKIGVVIILCIVLGQNLPRFYHKLFQ